MKRVRRAFTLVEMMVTVAVIVTLMAITFKLMTAGDANSRRTLTVERLQRLENCLSGYYAAFGSYPPVHCGAVRDIYAKCDDTGAQMMPIVHNENIWGWSNLGVGDEWTAWTQVRAVCRAQPIGCRFPYDASLGLDAEVADLSKILKEKLTQKRYAARVAALSPEQKANLEAGFDAGTTSNINRFNGSGALVFSFGLMSYLLPRYMVMISGEASLYETFEQWTSQNAREVDPMTGRELDWGTFASKIKGFPSEQAKEDWVKLIPSQGVCARWISNLEKTCDFKRGNAGGRSHIMGIDISNGGGGDLFVDNFEIEIFHPKAGSHENQYVLDGITLKDGWGQEYYYYSPAPYQSYVAWSSGANCRTFPPWIPRDTLPNAAAKRCAGLWAGDDITTLSH